MSSQNKPRCKKCGRSLRDPVSIARGMGPVCAGDSGRGRSARSTGSRRHAKQYSFIGNGFVLEPLAVHKVDQENEKPAAEIVPWEIQT